VAQCERFSKIRVTFFVEQLSQLKILKNKSSQDHNREIQRQPGNPMLRQPQSAAEKSQSSGEQQLSFLPIGINSYEHDTDKTPDAGAAAPRYGHSSGEDA
jgi:hypothetical protein